MVGLGLGGSCLALVVSGAFATAAGPHAGDSSKIHRLGTPITSVTAHARHRVFSCAFLFVLGYLAARRTRSPRLFAARSPLLGVLLVQVAARRDPVPHRPAVVARARARHHGGAVWAAPSRSSRCSSGRRPTSRRPHVDWERGRAPDLNAPDPRAAGPDRRLPRLERRRPGARRSPLGYLARAWEAERFADIDPEGFFDFQVDAAAGDARRRDDAPDRLARERLLPRPAARLRPRRRPAARHRAEPALAHVHGARRRAGAASSASSSS